MPKLTDRLIGSLKVPPGAKDRIAFDTECKGLGVRVTAKGTRTFIVQWHDKATGKKRRQPLGVIWGAETKGTLADARSVARAVLGRVAQGHDPIAEQKQRKEEATAERRANELTLDGLISAWASIHLAQKRPKYGKEAARALRVAFKAHLQRPAAQLSHDQVTSALDALEARGAAAMTSRTAAYGRACFKWANRRKKRPEHVDGNPFLDRTIAATEDRDRVLSESELFEIWEAAGDLGYPFGHWMRFAMLTLQRGHQECAAACWSEMSADLTTWEIPGSRMKNGRSHAVHLSIEARDLLRSIQRLSDSDLIFTTTGSRPISGFSKAKTALDKIISAKRAERAKTIGTKPAPLVPWRFHDFRRSGASRLADWEFDTVAIDRLLAHRPVKLKGVGNVYQKAEFLRVRQRMLDAWGAYLTGDRNAGANVLPFKAGA